MDRIQGFINNITLTKEEEKSKYSSEFIELYGDPKSSITPREPSYITTYNKAIKELVNERKKYSSNVEFYTAMAQKYASIYIPILIKEFNITDESLKSQLESIATGVNIKIFNSKEEVDKWIQLETNGAQKKLVGDYGAFKFDCYICFTPEQDSKQSVTINESIEKCCLMLSSMIHETIHLIINVCKKERFNYKDKSKLTSGGYIINEGLVELYALEISKKNKLLHLPAMYYMNNVELCRVLRKYYGEERFNELVLNGTYEELIPERLLEQYKAKERIRYFDRLGNIERIREVIKKIASIDEVGKNICIFGGAIPYIRENKNSGRKHSDIDILVNEEYMNKLRILLSLYNIKPEIDSIDFGVDKDYGLKVFIDGIYVEFEPFTIKDNKFIRRSFSPNLKLIGEETIPFEYLTDIITELKVDDIRTYAQTNEFIKANKELYKREKDVKDINFIDSNGIEKEKYNRIKKAISLATQETQSYEEMKIGL